MLEAMGPLQLLLDGQFLELFAILLVLVIAITIHEFGHAFAADFQGDRTARLAGRLTLNPLSHLDPLGSVLLVLAGFGWGKPVPFDPRQLRSQRFGAAVVALAGPVTNVILAFAFAYSIRSSFVVSHRPLVLIATLGVHVNVLLAIFNLIPIPPLDGSRILGILLPPNKQHIIYFLDKWGFLILLVLVFFLFGRIVSPMVESARQAVFHLVGL